ncbi:MULTISPECIES: molybdopterin molybdotransferase MoeA [Comamonas]|jgi:molybdopterin molybdotransferase|uniref:molybdopterin molybdotransferase MoeA n=1 Tax=Comamonas TaxID=283 RepID=UPI0012BED891|nr:MULTISPECIES: molybdopterin-binding protein [Comamonas]MDR3066339.1 molybdopterin molybdenumtransferase MoeA [Comamonas sp.]MEB5964692.1 molybdopterin-binding protein [Comamonas testosteroni]MPS93390.1 molybdopterin molybdenumtransferase MoeA [Comamonas sp.]
MTATFQPAASTSAPTLTTDQVLQQLQALLQPLGAVAEVETLPLPDALDRVLAADVICPVNVPPHDNSAMDGYAFAGSELAQAGPGPHLRLRVAGTARAGSPWQGRLGAGECVKIMTGAVMPAGADTVVAHEQTSAIGESIQFDGQALRAGANRRLRGEDLERGSVALQAGQRLTPAALGLLASLGLGQVSVRRRLSVAYFSTGDELLSPGTEPREAAIYDSNRFSLQALLRRLGAHVLDLGAVPDEPGALEDRLREAATLADVVLTSGGISAGEADHTRAMLQRLGTVQFWRVAMRPGRPLAVGLLAPAGGISLTRSAGIPIKTGTGSSLRQSSTSPTQRPAVLLGLPGNPVAAMVSFLMFVRPALAMLAGERCAPVPLLQAISSERLRKRAGRTEYLRGVLERNEDGQTAVRTTGPQGSGVLSSMVAADCIIVLDDARGDVEPGESVNVLLLQGLI